MTLAILFRGSSPLSKQATNDDNDLVFYIPLQDHLLNYINEMESWSRKALCNEASYSHNIMLKSATIAI